MDEEAAGAVRSFSMFTHLLSDQWEGFIMAQTQPRLTPERTEDPSHTNVRRHATTEKQHGERHPPVMSYFT